MPGLFLDTIKIDRAFVQDLHKGPDVLAVLHAMVNLVENSRYGESRRRGGGAGSRGDPATSASSDLHRFYPAFHIRDGRARDLLRSSTNQINLMGPDRERWGRIASRGRSRIADRRGHADDVARMTEALKASTATLRSAHPVREEPVPILSRILGQAAGPIPRSSWQGTAARYALAPLAVGVGALAQIGLTRTAGPMPPFVCFYPAVFLVALLGGGGPGVFACVLSAVVARYLYLAPAPLLDLDRPSSVVALGIFLATTGLLSTLAERIRRARWTERYAHQHREVASVTMASVGDAVLVTDLEGHPLFLNPAAETLLGLRGTDAVGRGLSSVLNLSRSGTKESVGELLTRVLGSASFTRFGTDLELHRSSGPPVPVELGGAPLYTEAGAPCGVVLTIHDCTEQRRARSEIESLAEKVRAEREWLTLVLESIADEVYFTDTEGRYLFANAAALREFGRSSIAGLDIATVVADLVVLRSDGTPRPIEEAPPLRALCGDVIRAEEQIVRNPQTGEYRHRQVSAAPVRSPTGELLGSVSVVRDITERKRAEAVLRDADRRKDEFLATLSHELRNPLAPIRMAAQLLASPRLDREDLQRCQGILARQVGHMARLLDDLLDVSRFTRGELALKRAYVPLQPLIEAAIETVQPLLDTKRHRLHLELPERPLQVEVDPIRLTQVISNLLSNAAKYTPAGGDIFVGMRVEKEILSLYVRDSGIGIAPESAAVIFNMFVQVERGEGGLGIGLALASALVAMHGGRIDVESAGLGQGSTFTVKLPRSVLAAEGATAQIGREAARDVPYPGRCILVADDNADAAETCAMLLKHSGHAVHVARDGQEALRLAAQVRPDLAILDIGMPGLSGYEVAIQLRREAWGERITLVAVTGWGQENDIRKARAAGFDHHFKKPIDPEALQSLVCPSHESEECSRSAREFSAS